MRKRRKSLKKLIQKGSVIRTFSTPFTEVFYFVTELKENTFMCRECNDSRFDIQQIYEFYYNIPMSILNTIDHNFKENEYF